MGATYAPTQQWVSLLHEVLVHSAWSFQSKAQGYVVGLASGVVSGESSCNLAYSSLIFDRLLTGNVYFSSYSFQSYTRSKQNHDCVGSITQCKSISSRSTTCKAVACMQKIILWVLPALFFMCFPRAFSFDTRLSARIEWTNKKKCKKKINYVNMKNYIMRNTPKFARAQQWCWTKQICTGLSRIKGRDNSPFVFVCHSSFILFHFCILFLFVCFILSISISSGSILFVLYLFICFIMLFVSRKAVGHTSDAVALCFGLCLFAMHSLWLAPLLA